jgi:hypothetical protein
VDNQNELQGVFDGIGKQFEDIEYEQALQSELTFLAELHKSFFDASTGPDGQPWAANAPRTIQAKGHSVILRGRRGSRQKNIKATKRRPSVGFSRAKGIAGFRLATSLTAKTTQSHGDAIREAVETPNGAALRFGTSVEYAGYNQDGTSRAPARPHVGFTPEYIDNACNRLADFTVKELAK